MATATSSRVNRNKTVAVKIATIGIIGSSTNTAVAINWISRCPAVKLAVNRTPKANGRINRLIVSIIIKMGISGMGVPSGKRWPSATVGWLRIPIRTVASHSGTANPIFKDSCVVGVKVYGRSPSILIVIKKIIKEVSSRAHLCPPTFSGSINWLVKRLISQPWIVIRRLLIHRVEGVGYITQGKAIAMAISGTPRYDGLANWSKKLIAMVSLRVEFYALLC